MSKPALPASVARAPRSARMIFGSATLTFELFVVLFGSLAAFGLRLAAPSSILYFGVILTVLILLAASTMRLPKGGVFTVGWALGTLVQLALIASGVVVSAMYVVGVIFAVLWVVSWQLGGRIDRERAARDATTTPGN